jgi:hypothetical protein
MKHRETISADRGAEGGKLWTLTLAEKRPKGAITLMIRTHDFWANGFPCVKQKPKKS